MYQIFAFLRGRVVLSTRFVKMLKGCMVGYSRGRDNRSREARQLGDRRRESTPLRTFLSCQSGVEYIVKGVRPLRPPSRSSPVGTIPCSRYYVSHTTPLQINNQKPKLNSDDERRFIQSGTHISRHSEVQNLAHYCTTK
jgi:hypothetical protein